MDSNVITTDNSREVAKTNLISLDNLKDKYPDLPEEVIEQISARDELLVEGDFLLQTSRKFAQRTLDHAAEWRDLALQFKEALQAKEEAIKKYLEAQDALEAERKRYEEI